MTLSSTGRSRERVLLFGMEGVGKSLAALDIASRVAPNTLYVIDNDNAWDRMLEGQTLAGDDVQVSAEFRWDASVGRDGDWVLDDRWCVEGGNVVVFHVDGWVANTKAIEAVREEAGPDDWCCIDSGSALWGDVQDWYIDHVFGRSLVEHLLSLKMAKGDEEKDEDKWQIINAEFSNGAGKFLVNPPCHLIVTAEQKDVNPSKERDKHIVAMYGTYFMRPAGQKRMGHNVQTVIHLRQEARGAYKALTLKDRGGREKLVNDEVTDRGFGEWYLEEIAGWTESLSTSPPSSGSGAPVPKAKSAAPVAKKIIAKKG